MKTGSRLLKVSAAVVVLLGLAGYAPMGIAQSTGTFTATGDMGVARFFHTATLLANGKVLIMGGVGASGSVLTAAELYDPNTGTFAPTGNMTTPRGDYSATLLADGRVLLVGGDFGTGLTQNTAELYDPSTGTFTVTGGSVTGQIGGRATLLHNGKVLIAGGYAGIQHNYPFQIANPELYDPSTGTFTPTGPFATTGSTVYVTGGPDISAVALLPDGRVLIAGEPTSELYDPATNTFSLTSPMTTPCSFGGKPLYIGGRTATLLPNGKILVTGGEHEDCGRFANAELYDGVTETFTPIGSMTRVRDNHRATLLPEGTVLVSGGETENCDARGCTFSGTSATVEAFDPVTGAFAPIGDMSAPRAGHTSTLLQNGTVLMAGGYGFGGIGVYLGTFASAELYTPPLHNSPVTITTSFDRASVRLGDSFTATFSGTHLTDHTFFDVRFHKPGSETEQFALNWQQGPSSTHGVPLDTDAGTWAITGVRAHDNVDDHTSDYFPILALLTVSPLALQPRAPENVR